MTPRLVSHRDETVAELIEALRKQGKTAEQIDDAVGAFLS